LHIKRVGGSDHFVLEDPEATVSWILPGYITLLTEGLQQLFANPRRAPFDQLSHAFPDLKRVQESAECYTEGTTNKQKFIKNLYDHVFCIRYDITDIDRKYLLDFIARTDLPPPTIRQQLHMSGYGRIAEIIDFADPKEEFIRTCSLFWEFVVNSRTISL
jgi:hypothetical protein